MADIPELEILVVLNRDRFDRDRASLLGDIARLEQEVIIPVRMEESGLRQIIGDVNALDSERITPRLDIDDGNLVDVRGDIDRLDGKRVDVPVDLDPTGQADLFLQRVQSLESGISIAATITGGAVNLVRTLVDFSGVPGLIETQQVLGRIEAQTGTLIPQADELINGIFVAGWGETRTQIGGVLAQAVQFGIELDQLGPAVENALMLSEITEEDPTELLRAMTNLVRNELVPNFDAAGDVLITGFQTGLNIGGDFLDTMNEYGPVFSSLGFDTEETLNVLNAGLRAGIWNTDQIAVSFQEFRTRAMTLGELDPIFENLGLEDAADDFRNGRIEGDEFVTMVMQRLSTIENPVVRQTTAVQLFGTAYEDFDPQTFLDSMTNIDEQLEITEGALDEAGEAIARNLPAAIDRAKRALTTGVGELLDEQFNITGLVDDLAGDLQTFFDSLQAGDDFSTSFRVAFDDNEIVAVLLDIREVLSDVFFGIADALADVLDFIPGATGDSIRDAISNLGQAELVMDISTVQDASDLEDAVSDAMRRGVDDTIIAEQLQAAWEQAVATSDIELLEAAAEGMRELASQVDEVMQEEFEDVFGPTPVDISGDVDAEIAGIDEQFQAAEEQIRESLAAAVTSALESDDVVAAFDINQQLIEAGGDDMSALFAPLLEEQGLTWEELEELANDGMQNVTTYVDDGAGEIDSSSTEVTESLDGMGEGFTDFREVADEELTEAEIRFTQFRENIEGDINLLAIALAEASGNFEALVESTSNLPTTVNFQGGVGGGGNTTTTTNNTTNNNVTVNGAAAAQGSGLNPQNLAQGGP